MIEKYKRVNSSFGNNPNFLALFFISIILSFALQSSVSLSVGVVVLALFVVINNSFRYIEFICLMLIFFICLPPIFSLHHGLSPLLYFILFSLSLIASRCVSQYDIAVIKDSLSRTYIVYAFCSLLAYIVNIDSPEPFEGLIPGTSTNGITSYLIVLQVSYSIIFYLQKGYFPVLSAFCTLFIAIIGIGRGSIYSAFLIVSFTLLFNFLLHIKNNRIEALIVFVVFSLSFVALLLINYDSIYDYMGSSTKALQGVNDSARINILTEYLGNLNGINLFTGQSFDRSLIGDKYDGNPHISYLRTHAYMGLFVILLMLSPLLVVFFKVDFLSKSFILFFILISLFRAVSEPILFPTLLDIFYLIPFFYLTKEHDSRTVNT